MLPEEPDERVDVPISAIEHVSYCPRQCALIHVEQTFDENLFTIRGQLAHERVDMAPASNARGVRVLRAVPLWSERYGLTGKADTVEIHPSGPRPVEYKVGRRHGRHPDLQLCAQALCLEEMFEAEVPRGAIYYHATRSRHPVAFDAPLREATIAAITAVRRILSDQSLPPAPNDARCPNCSLINACRPSVVRDAARIRGYQGTLFIPLQGEDVGSWLDD